MTTQQTVKEVATSPPVNLRKPNSKHNHSDYVSNHFNLWEQDMENSKKLDSTSVGPTRTTPTHFSSISLDRDYVVISNTPRRSEFPDIIMAIKRIQKGEYETGQTYQEFPLDSAQFSALREEFEQQELDFRQFVENKLRYQYSSNLSRLTIQMPTLIHNYVTALVSHRIHEQLRILGQNLDLKVANNIHLGYTANINLIINRKSTIYQPDQQFQFSVLGQPEPEFPAVVLETTFAQSVERVTTKSREYMEGSEFNINVVVAIKLGYQSLNDITRGKPYNQEAKLYSFRKAKNQNGEYVISEAAITFRDKDGTAVGGPGDGLSISLYEFLPRREWLPQHKNVTIFISCNDLFHTVHSAEEIYKNRFFQRSTRDTPSPRIERVLPPLPLPSPPENSVASKKRRVSKEDARMSEDIVEERDRGDLPDELKKVKHHTDGNIVEADNKKAIIPRRSLRNIRTIPASAPILRGVGRSHYRHKD